MSKDNPKLSATAKVHADATRDLIFLISENMPEIESSLMLNGEAQLAGELRDMMDIWVESSDRFIESLRSQPAILNNSEEWG